MTSTPSEPDSEPDLAPAGDPSMAPTDPDETQESPIPEAQPGTGS